jgi:hypothetical protein
MNTREAFEQSGAGGEFEPPIDWDDPSVAHARRTWQAATAAERERCAKVCDGVAEMFSSPRDYDSEYGAIRCADAIRRGE